MQSKEFAMTDRIRFSAVALAAACALSACSLAPTYKRPDADLAKSWAAQAGAADTSQLQDIPWESLYTDAHLRGLIRVALERNHDLRIAVGRMEEARALWGVQGADQLPSATMSVGRTASVTPAGIVNNSATPVRLNRYDANVNLVSFEVDFWGRVADLTQAAKSNYQASAEEQRVVRLGLISDVANGYYLVKDLELRSEWTGQTASGRQQVFDLTVRKQSLGAASDVDVASAQVALSAAQSEQLSTDRSLQQARNALAVLVGGRLPADLPAAVALDSQNLSLAWSADLSSDVLLRRPDVRAAEQRLVAANANIGVARAGFLPRLQLTGASGSSSTSLNGLFDPGSRSWNFMPTLQMPLFDWGRTTGNVDVAEARKVQAVATYEKTLQQAFREVADLLVARDTLQQQLNSQTRWVQSQQQRLRVMEVRYEQGAANQFELLDAQRDCLLAQQSRVQVLRQLLGATAQLYKALGGGEG
jgi:outer membrane protein, multidrug efflux system